MKRRIQFKQLLPNDILEMIVQNEDDLKTIKNLRLASKKLNIFGTLALQSYRNLNYVVFPNSEKISKFLDDFDISSASSTSKISANRKKVAQLQNLRLRKFYFELVEIFSEDRTIFHKFIEKFKDEILEINVFIKQNKLKNSEQNEHWVRTLMPSLFEILVKLPSIEKFGLHLRIDEHVERNVISEWINNSLEIINKNEFDVPSLKTLEIGEYDLKEASNLIIQLVWKLENINFLILEEPLNITPFLKLMNKISRKNLKVRLDKLFIDSLDDEAFLNGKIPFVLKSEHKFAYFIVHLNVTIKLLPETEDLLENYRKLITSWIQVHSNTLEVFGICQCNSKANITLPYMPNLKELRLDLCEYERLSPENVTPVHKEVIYKVLDGQNFPLLKKIMYELDNNVQCFTGKKFKTVKELIWKEGYKCRKENIKFDEEMLQEFPSIFPNITKINFLHCKYVDGVLPLLKAFKNLEELIFGLDSPYSEQYLEIFEEIFGLKRLTYLQFGSSEYPISLFQMISIPRLIVKFADPKRKLERFVIFHCLDETFMQEELCKDMKKLKKYAEIFNLYNDEK